MDIEKFYSTVIGSTQPPQRTAFFTCQIDLSPSIQTGIVPNPLSGYGFPSEEVSWDMKQAIPLLQQGLVCSSVTLPSREFQTTDLTIYGVEEKYPILSTFVDLTCEFLTPLVPSGGNSSRNVVAATFHHWQDIVQPMASVKDGFRSNGRENVPAIENLNFKFPDTYRVPQGVTIAQYTNAPKFSQSTGKMEFLSQSDLEIAAILRKTNPQLNLPVTYNIADSVFGPPTLVYHFYNVYPVRVDSSQLDWSDVDQFQRVRVSFAYTHWTTTRTRPAPDALPVQTAAESAQFTTSVPGIPNFTLTPPPPQGPVQDPE